MIDFLIFVLTAVIGTIGFALLFSIDLRHLPYAAIGGGLSWTVYLIIFNISANVLASSITAAFVATIFSEICAYYCKTPATIFILPSLIPLVPGGSLYYTMSNLLGKNYSASTSYAVETAGVVLGLSAGVVAGSLLVYAYRNYKKLHVHKNKCNKK